LRRIDRRPFRTITYLPMLTAWLAGNVGRYDLIHVHLANLHGDVAVIMARMRGIPLYTKLAAGGPRGEIGRLRPVAWLTRYAGIRWARRVQAISAEIARDLAALGIDPDRVVRIPNGQDDGVHRPASAEERAALRARLGLPENDVLVLYAGRFARYKGVLDLLQAWRGLEPPDGVTLVLVGEPALDDPVHELPQAPRVLVHPWTGEVDDYQRACDVVVLPSYAEGMSNALLEAMACGMAPVATRVGAAPEMIVDGESGFLIAPGDVTGLRDALRRLIGDRVLRERLGAAAAAVVAERYAIAPVVDQIEAAYAGMLAEVRG
jgi:glycosyltransferase involved in cell wall biosynthesis